MPEEAPGGRARVLDRGRRGECNNIVQVIILYVLSTYFSVSIEILRKFYTKENERKIRLDTCFACEKALAIIHCCMALGKSGKNGVKPGKI